MTGLFSHIDADKTTFSRELPAGSNTLTHDRPSQRVQKLQIVRNLELSDANLVKVPLAPWFDSH